MILIKYIIEHETTYFFGWMSPLKTEKGDSVLPGLLQTLLISPLVHLLVFGFLKKQNKKIGLCQFTKAIRRNFYYSAVPFFSSSYFDKFL